MTWYTASVLIAMRPKDYDGGPFEVYENMYLIEAPTPQEAFEKATQIGNEEASALSDDLTINDKPGEVLFLGIRKLINVRNPCPLDADSDRPVSGTEVTYSLYGVADEEAAAKLANGEDVDIVYLDE